MNEDKKKYALQLIGQYRRRLTRQQFLTLKGQVLAGQEDAALKGLNNLLKKKGGAHCEG